MLSNNAYHPIRLSVGTADVTTHPISRLNLELGTAYAATAIRPAVSITKSTERTHRPILFLSYRTYTEDKHSFKVHEERK